MKEYATIEQIHEWALCKMVLPPDMVIGEAHNPYMERWWIVPRNTWQNVYLHRILRDDEDRALHDHPFDNTSVIISGSYLEHVATGESILRQAGDVIERTAETAHRLELIGGKPCVSLFFTGPKVREWGFHCPNGWVPWEVFTAGENGELVGKGCGE